MGNETSAPANNPEPAGKIDIDISTLSNSCDATVRARGYRTGVINDEEIKLFRMTPHKLKRAVAEYHGKTPTDVFVKSPTPWGDLYTRYNWYPVEKTVKVVGAKVTDSDYTPVNVATRRYINNSDETATFKSCFTETITNTVSSTWSGEFGCNAGINYNMKFPGSVNLGYTAKCGVEVNRSKSNTITGEDSVEVTLGPRKSVIAHLTSRKNKVFVEVEYEISLKGDVACNYDGGYKGSCFWAFDVNDILEVVDKPTVVKAHEILELDYYSDGEIELSNINRSCSSTNSYCRTHGVRDYNFY